MSYSSCLMYSRSVGRGRSRSRFMSRGRKNHSKDDIRDSRSKSRSPRNWLLVHLQFVHLIYSPRITCFMVPTGQLFPFVIHSVRTAFSISKRIKRFNLHSRPSGSAIHVMRLQPFERTDKKMRKAIVQRKSTCTVLHVEYL